jgi:hypothetical protein
VEDGDGQTDDRQNLPAGFERDIDVLRTILESKSAGKNKCGAAKKKTNAMRDLIPFIVQDWEIAGAPRNVPRITRRL